MKSLPAKRAILASQTYAGQSRAVAGVYPKAQRRYLRWREPLMIFAWWRLALLLLPFVAALVMTSSTRNATARFVIGNYYAGTLDFWTDRFLAVWGRWDGEWYLQVASAGYNKYDSSAAFFPIYPTLLRLVGNLFLGNYMLAGIFISGLATVAAFILFYNLTLRDYRSELLARRSLIILAVFPTVFFLAAIYTEALFIALALAAFYCARHLRHPRKWFLAGFFVALAALTRNIGIILLAALVFEWWRQNRRAGEKWHFKPGSFTRLAWLVIPPVVTLGSWMAACWLYMGDPLMFVKAQNGTEFARRNEMPWGTIWQAVTGIFSPATFSEANLINLIFLAWWALLLIPAVRLVRQGVMPASYLIFYVLALLPGLCAPRGDQPLFALPRFVLVLFPAYQVMALIAPRSRLWKGAYLLASSAALVYLAVHFVQWSWVA